MRRRARAAVPSILLGVAIYVPLLLTRQGRVGADTKTYLYLDPGRLLSRAPSMWDPSIGLGTVTHQNIGYLWPIGPYYWLADALAVPDWVAQRFWTGSILFLAGLGVRFMLRSMGQEGPHVTAATFCYALTPYVLTLGARLSVILLPYAGLPWLLGLTVLALRHRRWREPAVFALVVATIGSVNATALILVGVAPILWILHEVVVTREVRFRDAAAVVARIGVLTTACSLWWLSGLWAQGGYGINILRYTETAETVATASVSLEVLRGLGYWFFYGEDRFGPWIAPSRSYMRRIDLLALSYLLPGLGLVGLAVARFRERLFFAVLLAVGLLLAVGTHPWGSPPPAGAALKVLLESEYGLAMRSLPRATPLVALSLAVFVGALIAALTANARRFARPLTAAAVAIAALALPPLWRLQMVDANLDRPEDLPEHWVEAAAVVDARGPETRVLEVPGTDFASYRWGNTVDPILPGLIDRPYVARELIPYGSPASANLVDAFDHRMQEGTLDPEAIAPMARFMAAGDVSVRSDLSFERYNTPRPRLLWDLVTSAPGLHVVGRFGPAERNEPRSTLPLVDEAELLTPPDLPDPPEVGLLEVSDPENIVRTSPLSDTVVLAGDGSGLVDATASGLLTGHESVLYSASHASDPDHLVELVAEDAPLVLTDTNRRAGQRWGTLRDNHGYTERAGEEPLRPDAKDQRLPVFPDADDRHATVTHLRGDVAASATSYGNTVTFTAEDRASMAVDGDVSTAWRTGGFSPATSETLRLDFREPVTTDHVRLLQVVGSVRNRHITEVTLTFDDDEHMTVELADESRPEQVSDPETAGQVVRFPERTFSRLEITIDATVPGKLPRYDGLSSVGFAEVAVVDRDGRPRLADEVVRLPTDLLDAFTRSLDHPLAVVLTRLRVPGTVAVRTSPEASLARSFVLDRPRSFTLTGQVRLSSAAGDDAQIDAALGIPLAEDGGVTARSRRRLPGGTVNRASAALDGDPNTWFSPGFLGQNGEWIDVTTAEPVTFDRFALTVLNDGRHSVPRRVRLEIDGAYQPDLAFDLAEVEDQPEPNARHTFHIDLPRSVTAGRVRLVVEESPEDPTRAVREVTTIDWYSGDDIVMPIGIVELGIDGLQVAEAPVRVPDGCRDDLLEVDGRPVSVALSGSTADLESGHPITLTTCGGEAVLLPAGTVTIRTAAGASTALDVDRLVLRSAPGGSADTGSGPVVPADRSHERPAVTIVDQTRTSYALDVDDRTEATWLILGQSHNLGWTAKAGGVDLGEPLLINGYGNAWLLPAGPSLRVDVNWEPQRVVDLALSGTVIGVLACLALISFGGPRRSTDHDEDTDPTWIPLDRRPSMPMPLSFGRVRRFAGPHPSRFALAVTVPAAALLGWLFIGPISGMVLGITTTACMRFPKARPVLTLGGPLLFAGSVGWVLVQQLFREFPSGFDWPTYFAAVHEPTLLAVALLLLDPVLDRCWLRRWWPSEDSPR